ncbi:MAG: DCC1-like thiol-disulfide oxidoreductase family protein [Candidatus Latescibacterota bacterium]
MDDDAGTVVLFDGECPLCSRAVAAIAARDPGRRLRFAALASAAGARLLAEHGLTGCRDTLVLLDQGRVHLRSGAALRIAGKLNGAVRLLWLLLLIPAPLRDLVYDFIARRRHRWFKPDGTCPVPPPSLRDRLLDS